MLPGWLTDAAPKGTKPDKLPKFSHVEGNQ